MKIFDSIFKRRTNILKTWFGFSTDIFEYRANFARTIFFNITDLLTDLCNDVTFTAQNLKGNELLFSEFKAFFNASGQMVLNRLFKEGYLVVGHNSFGFYILRSDEYVEQSFNYTTIVKAKDPSVDVYVMRSPTYASEQVSDYHLLKPFLTYLDNVLNASNTATARLGALVVASPKNPSTSPVAMVLTDEQKEKLENEIQGEYGALKNQKQVMLLPREMNFQTINLSGLDQHTAEKAKMAILAIADRIKVPANQISIIDAMSSKSFANGSELREGDFAKYQSFERLINRTFVKLANDCGLKVDYTIYNKPVREAQKI